MVDLLRYLPIFMREYDEIKKIMQVEQPEVQKLKDNAETLKDNQFILTCNEDGIERFEQMLGLVSYETDSLESRISRVIARWNDSLPYTIASLAERLDVLCGENAYELIQNFNEYKLTIITDLRISGQTDEVDKIIDEIIPCNIQVISKNEMGQNINSCGFAASPVSITKHIPIDTKTNTEYSIPGVIGRANPIATSKHRVINTI